MLIRILRVGITLSVMCPALAWSQCNVPDSVDYQVDFTATWSAQTLPQQFPANAHFSGLVGGSHNAQVSFWEEGELASNGIEEMAETGAKAALILEVNDAIGAGTALDVVSGGGIGVSPGFASTTFTLDQAHPLATVVSMIAPSPDWFVGVTGLNLFSGGNWLADVTVDLFAYDAGTDSGVTYTSANSDTQPPETISALTGAMFMQQGELVPFGTFRFLLLTESCPDLDGDYDGDGKSDILLRNISSGNNQLYIMNGTTIGQSLPLSPLHPLWSPEGRGDYNGDGKADILWRHANGAIWMYLMDGDSISSILFVATIGDANWKIVGNGDYNYDGKSDILFHHAINGTIWLYQMDSNVISTSTGIGTVPNTDWGIVGSGDYNGDGKSDILWRNAVSGGTWMYLMNGATISMNMGVSTTDTDYEVVGNGDYNGDGKSDILWRNSISGTNWIFMMDGASIASDGWVSTLPDTDWRVFGDGDYNGDGKADVLWRQINSGTNYLYLMNGFTIFDAGVISTVPDQNWRIVNSR